jgi:hypothetical protein
MKAAFVLAIACGLVACGNFETGVEDVVLPAFDTVTFRSFSAVMERRCGTLDCHGDASRPLRIYGQYGLRRPEPVGSPNVENYAEYYSGGKEPSTLVELEDNYRSICALEPELTAEVFAKKSSADVLTVVRKARLREKHKGGLLWNKGEPGDVCMTNWLTGNADLSQCEVELGHP